METMNKFISCVFYLLRALCHFKPWTVKKIALFLAPTHFVYYSSLWDGDKSHFKAKLHCLVVSLAIRCNSVT